MLLLYAIIEITKKKKRETFITFYDISKAYDTVDNPDMLTIMWDKGLKGKCWRILKNLNTNLKARVKTRFGTSDAIDMDVGGKQGSRLTGRLFSKMMDMLAEDLLNAEIGFTMTSAFRIPILLWVDDVVSCVEGKKNQIDMLKRLSEFAWKHKLEWSASKCMIMRVGRHRDEPTEWQLGNLNLQETSQYKYLGDVVTNNGRHTENIRARKQKTQATTTSINTISSSEILNRVESLVLLELHERLTIPALLNNAESWVLNKTEMEEIERVEMQALKQLFKLPTHTPNVAVTFIFGTLLTKQRIDLSQLLYLHKLLSRPPTHWTVKAFYTLEEMDIGWVKNIKTTLQYYNLSTDLQEIKTTPRPDWSRKVKSSIETKHIERLKEQCQKLVDGNLIPKTKTASIVPIINTDTYKRQPQYNILKTTKRETRTIMLARYGLLQCGRNYQGTSEKQCNLCSTVDDENHRLNFCPKWQSSNLFNAIEKVDFTDVYSDDLCTIRNAIMHIEKTWNTHDSNGSMRT